MNLNLLAERDNNLYLILFDENNRMVVDMCEDSDNSLVHNHTHKILNYPTPMFYTIYQIKYNDIGFIGYFQYISPYECPMRLGHQESKIWLEYLSHLLIGYNFNGLEYLSENLHKFGDFGFINNNILNKFLLVPNAEKAMELKTKIKTMLELTS